MSLELEKIKDYLPKYLSISSKEDLFKSLDDFPQNIESRLYSDKIFYDNDIEIIQGDGIDGLLFFNYPAFISYCPLVSFEKYISGLAKTGKDITSLEKDIKLQKVTSMFYLPKGQSLYEDKIAMLEKIQSCPNNEETRSKAKKIFTLSNYEFYLFLLKLSIHFTRIRDGVDRVVGSAAKLEG